MREFKIIAAIADVHIGNRNISPIELKSQLRDHFLTPIKKFRYLDGIFVLGDLLHTIISLNSDYSEVYLWFVDKIYRIAKTFNATVIIIKGTQSHDNDQLDNIRSYSEDPDVDFRIYDDISVATIWDDHKVLILPDIKPKQLSDIDRYLIDDCKYDMILGHGTVQEMQYHTQESENAPTKTYVYDTKKLVKASIGPILFGHIHQHLRYRDKFYYVGPFTLLERGGHKSGFVVCGYSKSHGKYRLNHYQNPDASSYIDIKVTKDIIDTVGIDELFVAIDSILEDANSHDLITLRITRGDNVDASDKVLLLETRYRKDSRISIVKKIKTKSEEESDKKNAKKKEKFEYLLDNNLELPALFYRYYTEEVVPTLDSNTPRLSLADFGEALDIQNEVLDNTNT